jgi:pimeloyl-ACP methyl ester carboxylesterase
VALARAGGTRRVMEANLPQLVNPEQHAAMRAGVIGPEPYQPMDPADGLYRRRAGARAPDRSVPWGQRQLPVLAMSRLHDRIFRVAADVEELSARIAGIQRVDVPDAGHLVPVERPAAFAQALLAFAGKL